MEEPHQMNARLSQEEIRPDLLASKEEAEEYDQEKLKENLELKNGKIVEIDLKDGQEKQLKTPQEELEEEEVNKRMEQINDEDIPRAKPIPVAELIHVWKDAKKGHKKHCILCDTSLKGKINKCSRCKRRVHVSCIEKLEKENKHLCRPPHFKLLYTDDPDATPLIVFTNAKSGGQQGTKLFYKFVQLLGKEQVFDLVDGGPTKGLQMYKGVKNLRVLVAGGDGSVGWVLTYLDILVIDPFPAVGIIPLGTGNDLARCMNWGGGYHGQKLLPLLMKVAEATVVPLDRWTLKFDTQRTETVKNVVMNNYISLGADAAVALRFHETRNAHPDMFKSRPLNKMWYGMFGLDVMVGKDYPLAKVATLTVDDEAVHLPKSVQGIIILNVNSYSAGQDLWGSMSNEESKRFTNPTSSDGLLEIVTVKGAFQMGLIIAKMSKPKKLKQGKVIKITLNQHMPIQVDGEPWVQEPCTLRITALNQANMLFNQK